MAGHRRADDQNLLPKNKQQRKREYKREVKRMQVKELSGMCKPDSTKPALKPKMIARFLGIKVTEVYRLRRDVPSSAPKSFIPMSRCPVLVNAMRVVIHEIGLQ